MAGGNADPFAELAVVGALEGSRSCESCGYDLKGQHVRHEPRYGVLLVRCPECGEFTGVSGRGTTLARRWGTAGGPRLLVVIALFAGLGGLVGGLAQSTGFAAAAPLARRIAGGGSGREGEVFQRVQMRSWIGMRGAIISRARADGRECDPSVLSDLLWLPVGAVPMGVAIALAAPRMRRRQLYWANSLAMAGAGVGLAGIYLDSQGAFGWEYAMTLAEWECGVQFGLLAYGAGVVVAFAAVGLARPLTRRLVLGISGGRAAGSLVLLWTADGLPPPI